MARYTYEVINGEGRSVGGTLRAEGERAAARELERRGLMVVSLRMEAAGGASRGRQQRLRNGDVILAVQELATMLTSGVPIAEAVGSQALAAHHPRIVGAFTQIGRELQRGQQFSTAMQGSGLPLPDYAVQLARAGELTGDLGRAMTDAAAQMEYEEGLRTEMRNALIYPAVLVVAGVAAVALMFLFVVPKFASLLSRAEDLPFLAWAVLGTGTWLRANFGAFVAVIVVATVAIVAMARRPQVRARALDAAARLPLVGPWLIESDTARWSKVLSALLGNRVALMRALELAQDGLQIPYRRSAMGDVVRAVRNGATLADALEDYGALTATGYNLVRVGEKTGKLSTMLESLARLYAEAGRTRMKRLLILIEPVAILLIGGVIGTIILGVILAITSANDLAV